MALLLVDWTDPLKVVGGAGDLAAQLDTACDLVEAAEEAEGELLTKPASTQACADDRVQ